MKKPALIILPALLSIGASACVAGPGGMQNGANRTITGAALGALLGGVAGKAGGDPAGGLVLGALAGGALGAVIDPGHGLDTRGYCYTVDPSGQPITILANETECKLANGQPAPAKGR